MKYPKDAGIYKLTCVNNGKIYIGKSISINRRLKVYPRCGNDIGIYIKNAIIKHGWNSFEIEILETVDDFDKTKDNKYLLDRESYYIKLYDSSNKEKGYNVCIYSTDRTGIPHSDKTKEKLRLANLGKKLSEKTREKMRNKKLSDEHKEKLRMSHLGIKRSEETKQKLRIANSKPKTTPVSEEHRRNLSKAGQGRIFTPEHRENLRLSAIKRGISKETREKMRQTNKGRPLSEAHKAKLRNKKLSPEHKEALRNSNIGTKHSEETKEKMRIAALNRKSKMKEL